MMIWPNITRPKLPCAPARVPAYLIQLPTSVNTAATMMAPFAPYLLSV